MSEHLYMYRNKAAAFSMILCSLVLLHMLASSNDWIYCCHVVVKVSVAASSHFANLHQHDNIL